MKQANLYQQQQQQQPPFVNNGNNNNNSYVKMSPSGPNAGPRSTWHQHTVPSGGPPSDYINNGNNTFGNNINLSFIGNETMNSG